MRERVSLVPCDSEAADGEVVHKTIVAIRELADYWCGFAGARKIAVKINAGVARFVLTDGKQTEVTEPAVIEGVIRAIRDVSDAEIVIGDAATDGNSHAIYDELGLPERLARFPGVRLVEFGGGQLVDVPTPNGLMFGRYTLHRELAEAEAFVSIAKMKAHRGMGCTLCIKNLFGWTPPSVYGQPRNYLHDRLIRLPYVLADLAALMRPCLNVIDGIVAANKGEWHGIPMRPGVIVAGTNIVATDHVGARVMGFEPRDDYPHHPFWYRRNVIKLASEAGIGPNSPDEIEVVGPPPEAVQALFYVEKYGGDTERDEQLRRGVDCVARYRTQQEELAERFANRYLALYDGEVLWDGPDVRTMQRLERESGRGWQDAPQFMVRCVPPGEDIERYERYAFESARLPVATVA